MKVIIPLFLPVTLVPLGSTRSTWVPPQFYRSSLRTRKTITYLYYLLCFSQKATTTISCKAEWSLLRRNYIGAKYINLTKMKLFIITVLTSSTIVRCRNVLIHNQYTIIGNAFIINFYFFNSPNILMLTLLLQCKKVISSLNSLLGA